MAIENIWVAHSVGELRLLLQQMGVATAPHVVFVEGLDGLQDAGFFFRSTTQPSNSTVGFNTDEVSVAQAKRLLGELTSLHARTAQVADMRIITMYV